MNAYSAQEGSLTILSTLGGTTCNTTRRHLRDPGTIEKQKNEHSHRNLASLPGFTFKLPTSCRLCTSDINDMSHNPEPSIGLTIRVKTDRFPREFSYKVMTKAGETVHSSSEFLDPDVAYSMTLLLKPQKAYKIVISDLGGNGLCCGNGDGFIQLVETSKYGSNILFVERDTIGFSKTLNFVTSQAPDARMSETTRIENDYAEYLSNKIDQAYNSDKSKCLYMKFPTVSVRLDENRKINSSC